MELPAFAELTALPLAKSDASLLTGAGEFISSLSDNSCFGFTNALFHLQGMEGRWQEYPFLPLEEINALKKGSVQDKAKLEEFTTLYRDACLHYMSLALPRILILSGLNKNNVENKKRKVSHRDIEITLATIRAMVGGV